MGFVAPAFLCIVVVLLPQISHSQDFTSSRATYYGSPDCLGTPTGACGFKEYGRTVNDANVAGVSRLWKIGTGCGACYPVRCNRARYQKACTDEGLNIVVTDYGEGDNTDLILSTRAYSRLARPNMASELFAYGVVDIEYKRISCTYAGYNLMVKVHEHSKFCEYIALIMLYQAGQSDIRQEDCKEWRGMRRAYGAVWDMPNPPKGALTLRFQVGGSGWVQVNNAIPNRAVKTGLRVGSDPRPDRPGKKRGRTGPDPSKI